MKKKTTYLEVGVNLEDIVPSRAIHPGEELRFKLSSEDFKTIKNDASFIKGYFTSNKALIDLSK